MPSGQNGPCVVGLGARSIPWPSLRGQTNPIASQSLCHPMPNSFPCPSSLWRPLRSPLWVQITSPHLKRSGKSTSALHLLPPSCTTRRCSNHTCPSIRSQNLSGLRLPGPARSHLPFFPSASSSPSRHLRSLYSPFPS